jgi:hypothetical protein
VWSLRRTKCLSWLLCSELLSDAKDAVGYDLYLDVQIRRSERASTQKGLVPSRPIAATEDQTAPGMVWCMHEKGRQLATVAAPQAAWWLWPVSMRLRTVERCHDRNGIRARVASLNLNLTSSVSLCVALNCPAACCRME